MTHNIHPDVMPQLRELDIVADRPLLILDADEVLLQFTRTLEKFLDEEGLYFNPRSFALAGNIHDKVSGKSIDNEALRGLISQFFVRYISRVPPVPGAAEAVGELSRKNQICILSNIPVTQRAARSEALRRDSLDFPLIANQGSKGGVVKYLAEQVTAPVIFMDDIPRHHAAVAEAAAHVYRIHFVADPRLARLVGPAEHCHHRTDLWPEAKIHIEQYLQKLGF